MGKSRNLADGTAYVDASGGDDLVGTLKIKGGPSSQVLRIEADGGNADVNFADTDGTSKWLLSHRSATNGGEFWIYNQTTSEANVQIKPNGDIGVRGSIQFPDPAIDGISFLDGGGDYNTKHTAIHHVEGGYSAGQNFWHNLQSKGGTFVTLNTDGARTSGRNTYDHFSIWQKAPNHTDGLHLFSVDNAGQAFFAHAGVSIDRGWNNDPSITVWRENHQGVSNVGNYFRIHGYGGNHNTWWGGAAGADFSVSMIIDGSTYATSDGRKKINKATIENAVETVKKLDGKRFQIINNEGTVQANVSSSGYKYGFIAQEVIDVIPDAVTHFPEDDDGTDGYNSAYAIDYSSLVALLTNAVKEQQATIEALTARVEALEA